ncbi:subtilisin-like proprotein convertase family protein [Chryseobacterium defluvii]|uniref:Subtilisin-like proprotein convertase family protein n=1 Tax=Chryseobacterium defluvii TaxID=160396 RepID=A0A840KAL0_9FLAO|nr:zinc-dependent metalloprotease family protein [Chryseobacterium defluvii]MBB4805037.1 subtilisin-like proprotein convertase family protein [Chryseobacterium defluvii]
MKRFLFISALLAPILGFAQWSKTELRSQAVKKSQEKLEFSALYNLDVEKLKNSLKDAPSRSSSQKGIIISIPGVNGKVERFRVWEFSNMAPELQAKYPDIRSYVGTGVDNPSAYLRFSLSPVGFSSMISRGGISEYIEPYTDDRAVYAVFDSNARKNQPKEPFECTTPDELGVSSEKGNSAAATNKAAGFNVFRLAISCTNEYAQYHITAAGLPGTATEAQKKAAVLAAMNATVTRLNSVFERDLSLHFNLVANNDLIIFTSAGTDPYTDGDEITDVQSVIDTNIGSANYDMGHIFDKEGGNGYAPGDICDSSSKAEGWTASNFPDGDRFDIDYVAHEMGHQLGANHSFSYSTASGNLASLVEPGSGSTIMAYTGITDAYDVQFNSDDYYHTFSVTEIKNRINSLACGVNTPFAGAAPNINAGADYVIPKSTPFVLRGTTTDASTAAYTYTWEQMDSGSSQTGNNSIPYATKASGPTFRSVKPTSSPVRYFPDFNKVLAGVLTTKWETVSSVGRNLNFAVTVRSNHPTSPQTSRDAMIVTVNAASGPFRVTAPTFGQALLSGTPTTVTWDVANTTAAPVSTANVNIKLSTDGGQTFTTLLANTANDGTESVMIPAGSVSPNAFIMVEAVNNIYYALSPSFVVDYTVSGETCNNYTYSGPAVTITDGPGGDAISAPKVSAPLMVNNTGVITSIKVTPSIAHTYVQDLSVGIESPVGTSALIWNRSCTNQDNIIGSFSDTGTTATCTTPIQGEIRSSESLAVFKGHSAQGQWKLFASDNYTGDQGTINSWTLQVCTRNAQAVLGVNDANAQSDDIKIYPNPSNGNFFIKSRNISGEIKVTLFDSSGRLIHSSAYKGNGDTTEEFNLNISKGVYMINVNSSKGVYNQKLLIK